MGWYLNGERVYVISADTRGDLLLVAHWQVLEGDFYDIVYVFDKGEWPTRDAESVQEVVDALFTDYYNWAVKYYNYKVHTKHSVKDQMVNIKLDIGMYLSMIECVMAH